MSFLSAREEVVFRAWRKVPPELWSDPSIYDPINYAKFYKKIQKKGLAAIGFDKIKLFETCLSLMKERDQIEDIHVDLVEGVFSLLPKHDAVIHHYDVESNAIYSFRRDDYFSGSYPRNSLDAFNRKLSAKVGLGSFALSSENISAEKLFTACGNRWQRTTHDYSYLGVYPEVQEYLVHKEKWQKIKDKIRNLSEALPVLFEIETSDLKYKPCLILHGEKQFYLIGYEGYHNIVLNYEAASLCII